MPLELFVDTSQVVLGILVGLNLLLGLNGTPVALLIDVLEVWSYLLKLFQRGDHQHLVAKHADCVIRLDCNLD